MKRTPPSQGKRRRTGAAKGKRSLYSPELGSANWRKSEVFQRILALPRKARSTRDHAPELAPADDPEAHPAAKRPAVITYSRQGRLDKFFRAHDDGDLAQELDFFCTAAILETTPKEKRGEIDAAQCYPLLDKNKTALTGATTPTVETLLPVTAAGSGNEAIVLKRLRAKDVRTCDKFTQEDRKFIAAVHQIIAGGRVRRATIKKVKDAPDNTADPVEMLAILRRDIARQYLVAVPQKQAAEEPAAPREVTLSSYLP